MKHSLTGAPMELTEVDAVTVFMGKTVNYRRVYYYSPGTGDIATTQEQDEENHRRMESAAAGLPLDEVGTPEPDAAPVSDSEPDAPKEA